MVSEQPFGSTVCRLELSGANDFVRQKQRNRTYEELDPNHRPAACSVPRRRYAGSRGTDRIVLFILIALDASLFSVVLAAVQRNPGRGASRVLR